MANSGGAHDTSDSPLDRLGAGPFALERDERDSHDGNSAVGAKEFHRAALSPGRVSVSVAIVPSVMRMMPGCEFVHGSLAIGQN